MTKPKHTWRCQKCDCLGVQIPRAHPRSKICAWCAADLAAAGLRWCTKGRHASSDWPSNTAPMCRNCQRAANRARRDAHHEEALSYSRAYYAANREELNAAGRAYYAANREQLLEQKREYYRKKRELIKAKVRAHRPLRSQASREKERVRHKAKHQIYKHNEKLARARRFLNTLRGTE